MENLEKQENATGQPQDPKEKLLLPASSAKKRKLLRDEGSQTACQSKNGLPILEMKKQTKESLENEADSGSETIPQKKPKKEKSLMPVPKLPSNQKRAAAALKRLKVKVEALANAPALTSMIKSTVTGGLSVALEAMKWATEDQEIKSFLKTYNKIPIGDRGSLSWEAISIAAKVNPKHLLGSIQLAVDNHCRNKSRFIGVSSLPAIAKARVKYGKMAGGERDRTQLEITHSILPSPKGPTFVGKQVAVYNAGGSRKDDDGDTIEAAPSLVYQGGDVEDRLFGTPQSDADLDNKLIKIRERRLEGL
jgi:hypothetical protein